MVKNLHCNNEYSNCSDIDPYTYKTEYFKALAFGAF